MKTTGIIAEYNPFHNGHAYHIKKTKELTGADYIIAVMSGNFVQRGAPALLDKYERARMALENGADVVIELPSVTALSSAEGFARGGISLLTALGVVTDVSFGCEITDETQISYLHMIAQLFAEEPETYRQLLSSYLKSGISYPAARMSAAETYLKTKNGSIPANCLGLLKNPNNILAVEYLKTIYKYKYSICPRIIARSGSPYHDLRMEGGFASAHALRNYLLDKSGLPDLSLLSEYVPASVCKSLSDAAEHHRFLQEDDFSDLLFHALTDHYHDLNQYGSLNEDFTLRLQKHLEYFESWNQFIPLLKTKNRTYSSISRYFSQLLNGIRQEHFIQASGFRFAPYARILGFHKSAAPLLKEMHQKSRIPIITKLSEQMDDLKKCQKNLLDVDIRASRFYGHILFSKSGEQQKLEFRRPLITL